MFAANSGTDNHCHSSWITLSSYWPSIWSQSSYITSCCCKKAIAIWGHSSWYIPASAGSKGRKCEYSIWVFSDWELLVHSMCTILVSFPIFEKRRKCISEYSVLYSTALFHIFCWNHLHEYCAIFELLWNWISLLVYKCSLSWTWIFLLVCKCSLLSLLKLWGWRLSFTDCWLHVLFGKLLLLDRWLLVKLGCKSYAFLISFYVKVLF
jgi:hypothetical protein